MEIYILTKITLVFKIDCKPLGFETNDFALFEFRIKRSEINLFGLPLDFSEQL